jgi:hypothetical protein
MKLPYSKRVAVNQFCHRLKIHPIGVVPIEKVAVKAFCASLPSDQRFTQLHRRIGLRAWFADPIASALGLKQLVALETPSFSRLMRHQSR